MARFGWRHLWTFPFPIAWNLSEKCQIKKFPKFSFLALLLAHKFPWPNICFVLNFSWKRWAATTKNHPHKGPRESDNLFGLTTRKFISIFVQSLVNNFKAMTWITWSYRLESERNSAGWTSGNVHTVCLLYSKGSFTCWIPAIFTSECPHFSSRI